MQEEEAMAGNLVEEVEEEGEAEEEEGEALSPEVVCHPTLSRPL